jgi:hypothetical protein
MKFFLYVFNLTDKLNYKFKKKILKCHQFNSVVTTKFCQLVMYCSKRNLLALGTEQEYLQSMLKQESKVYLR